MIYIYNLDAFIKKKFKYDFSTRDHNVF